MTQIVGIAGLKRSGKNTVARILANDCTVGVVRQVAFADKLKILAARAVGLYGSDSYLVEVMDEAKLDSVGGWTIKLYQDPFPPFWELSGRQFLQNLGTEARHVLGDTVWLDQVLPNPARYHEEDKSDRLDELVEAMYPQTAIVAITDLRFENEARRVKDLGGVIWQVIRSGCESDGHASEQALPDSLIDWTIVNDGSLDDLRCRVEDAIQETLN